MPHLPRKTTCQFCNGDIDSDAALYNQYHAKCWLADLRIRYQHAANDKQRTVLAEVGRLVAKSLDES